MAAFHQSKMECFNNKNNKFSERTALNNSKYNSYCARKYSNNSELVKLLLIFSFILNLNSLCDGFLLDGSQNSYAQFRKWYTGLNGSIELEFKTELPNGLVLYTDDGGTYDFFELKLVEGALRLRFNLGGGAQIITVGRDLHDGHWHKVQVSNNNFFFSSHLLSFLFWPNHSTLFIVFLKKSFIYPKKI